MSRKKGEKYFGTYASQITWVNITVLSSGGQMTLTINVAKHGCHGGSVPLKDFLESNDGLGEV